MSSVQSSANLQEAQEGDQLASAAVTVDDTLLKSLLWMCGHYGIAKSERALVAGLPSGAFISPAQSVVALANVGLSAALVERRLSEVSPYLLPVILMRADHGGCILLGMAEDCCDESGQQQPQYVVVLPEMGAQSVILSHAELEALYAGFTLLVKPIGKVDERVQPIDPESAGHWLIGTLWRFRSYYMSAAVAALIINILTLAITFFTMNVYDRVVPNQAYVTLWSLTAGVAIALFFEFVSRIVRARLLDTAGKKADLIMGAMLFRQAMSIQMEHKPASSGAFANQLREFESVRDFVTSATLATLSDLPFSLLFILAIFFIAGPLGWVPAVMLPVIVVISLVIQWPLAKTMKENLRETSLKQGLLIESVEGLETLKATGGERYMQHRWEHFSALASASALKARNLSTVAVTFVTSMQQVATVALVVIGVYLIDAGELTIGGLIGSVILCGRAIAPLAQIAGLAVRFQQAKAALKALNQLMQMPVDRDPRRDYLPTPEMKGDIEVDRLSFSYPCANGQPVPPVLSNINLKIQAGERIAILGRIGSGKSTLLRVLGRFYQPTAGQIFTGGIDISQIDPADWRSCVGFVSQECRLFYGTLRQNIMLGRPEASLHEFLRVTKLVGLDEMAARHPLGYNLPVGEMGKGLSGGQQQLVSLARCLLARPSVLLLDEPTSAMDSQTEADFMNRLVQSTEEQTLILVTHRPSLLELVDRIVIIDKGEIVMDGPKAEVLSGLTGNRQRATPDPSKLQRQQGAL